MKRFCQEIGRVMMNIRGAGLSERSFGLGGVSLLLAVSVGSISVAQAQTNGILNNNATVNNENSQTSATAIAPEGSPLTGIPIFANYYAIFFGPSVQNPSDFQVTPEGKLDKEKPLLVKNYLTAGYNFNPQWAIAATGYWTWEPTQNHSLTLQDPQARIANNSIISTDEFNWYGDLRAHFPVTSGSRDLDMLAGFQNFNFVSWTPTGSRFTFGSYVSARYNVFGRQGAGNDLELYLAPSINYQMRPNLALTFLYEMGASHFFGDDFGTLNNDGTDFEPGISWEVIPSLTVNPYLNLYPGNKVSWRTTSVGATVSWLMM
jgi:hypothetical protein